MGYYPVSIDLIDDIIRILDYIRVSLLMFTEQVIARYRIYGRDPGKLFFSVISASASHFAPKCYERLRGVVTQNNSRALINVVNCSPGLTSPEPARISFSIVTHRATMVLTGMSHS
jgi:hypothetical protein